MGRREYSKKKKRKMTKSSACCGPARVLVRNCSTGVERGSTRRPGSRRGAQESSTRLSGPARCHGFASLPGSLQTLTHRTPTLVVHRAYGTAAAPASAEHLRRASYQSGGEPSPPGYTRCRKRMTGWRGAARRGETHPQASWTCNN